MSIGALSSSNVLLQLADMRQQLDLLQQQLGTGQKSTTYAGLGSQRSISLNARARLQNIESYQQNIATVDVRFNLIQTTLSRFTQITADQRAANLNAQFVQADGALTAPQSSARQRLDEILGLMNQDINGRHLFSGRATDKDAVLSVDQILDGDPPREGLKAVIEERRRADMGSDNLGRLAITAPVAGSVRLAETGAGVFGFKISGVTSSLSNATATPDNGPPPRIDVAFTGLPANGQNVQIALSLPDGTSTTLTLKATDSTAPGPGEFTIGADANATAANFQVALDSSLQDLSKTKLRAASALKSADDFFNVDATHAPQRVDIVTTPEAATSLRDGTSADTVTWYQGDNAADSARSTSTVRVDTSLTLGYGMRATEAGFRQMVAGLAAFAGVEFDANDTSSSAAYAELSSRVRDQLGDTGGQTVTSIETEMAASQNTMKAAKERNTSMQALFENSVSNVEGVSQEDIAAQILDLRTRLDASYQATAMLSKLSLVNFL
jgi:flagellar hook-associated protein 3 FlgL